MTFFLENITRYNYLIDTHWILYFQNDIIAVTNGLIPQHCYSVIKIDKISKPKTYLIKLRNPHGSNEWEGDWSDKDDERWKQLSMVQRKSLGYSDKNDGEFFMSLRDFQTYFGSLDFCHLNILDNSNFLQFHGNWKFASFKNHEDFSKLNVVTNFILISNCIYVMFTFDLNSFQLLSQPFPNIVWNYRNRHQCWSHSPNNMRAVNQNWILLDSILFI